MMMSHYLPHLLYSAPFMGPGPGLVQLDVFFLALYRHLAPGPDQGDIFVPAPGSSSWSSF